MNIPVTRGGWLTAFLIVGFMASAFGVWFCLDNWDRLNNAHQTWAVYALRIIVFLRPVSLLAIWLWSRSGVVSYIFLTIVAIPVCLAVGSKMSFVGIIGVVILILLVWPKWQYMSWGISAYPKVSADDNHTA